MMLQQIFLICIGIVSAHCACNETGTLTFSDISSPLIVPKVQCNGSYIQILIYPNETVPENTSYTLTIEDPKAGRVLVLLENDKHQGKNISLASWSNQVNISATSSSGLLPLKINYIEIPHNPRNIDFNATSAVSNKTIEDQVGPNSVVSYRVKVDALGDNFFDVKWDPKLSATTSFLAVRSSSGRITLITSKLATPFKLAVAENETVSIDVVTQNAPGDRLQNSLTLDISAGYEDPTTSTPPPPTTTPQGPKASARIFIMHVEEEVFANQSVPLVQEGLKQMGGQNFCNLSFGVVSSCREKCHLSDDPTRGCVDFYVTIERDTTNVNCRIENDLRLKENIEDLISGWKVDFMVDRIEVDDCMVSVQNGWLITAVAVTAGAFVLLVAILILVLKILPAKRAAEINQLFHRDESQGFTSKKKNNFVLKSTLRLDAFGNFRGKNN